MYPPMQKKIGRGAAVMAAVALAFSLVPFGFAQVANGVHDPVIDVVPAQYGGGIDAATTNYQKQSGDKVQVKYLIKATTGHSANLMQTSQYFVVRVPKTLEDVTFTFKNVPMSNKYLENRELANIVDIFNTEYVAAGNQIPTTDKIPQPVLSDYLCLNYSISNIYPCTDADMVAKVKDSEGITSDVEARSYIWAQAISFFEYDFYSTGFASPQDVRATIVTRNNTGAPFTPASLGTAEMHTSAPDIGTYNNAAEYQETKNSYADAHKRLLAEYGNIDLTDADTLFAESVDPGAVTTVPTNTPQVALSDGDYDEDGQPDFPNYVDYAFTTVTYPKGIWPEVEVSGNYIVKPHSKFLPLQVFNTTRAPQPYDSASTDPDEAAAMFGALVFVDYLGFPNHASKVPDYVEITDAHIDTANGNGVLGNPTCRVTQTIPAGQGYAEDVRNDKFITGYGTASDHPFNYVDYFHLNDNPTNVYYGFGTGKVDETQYLGKNGEWYSDSKQAAATFNQNWWEVDINTLQTRVVNLYFGEDSCDQVAAKVVPEFKVDFQYVSATAGRQLPAELAAMAPQDVTEKIQGDVVTPEQPSTKTYKDPDGKGTWSWQGWRQEKIDITELPESTIATRAGDTEPVTPPAAPGDETAAAGDAVTRDTLGNYTLIGEWVYATDPVPDPDPDPAPTITPKSVPKREGKPGPTMPNLGSGAAAIAVAGLAVIGAGIALRRQRA